MDARGTAELRDAHDRGLDVLAGHHHEIGELVDDDHEIGHLLGRVVVVLELTGGLFGVVVRDLADVELLKDLEAALHLGYGPLQRARGLLGLSHHGNVEMRQPVVAGELHALGVDHDQANVLGTPAHEQRGDDGIDHHRLTRTGRTGDKQVRHLGQVGDDGSALGIASDGELERTALDIGQNIAEVDVLTRAVGNLDADERGAWNRRKDTNGLRSE